MSDSRLDYLFWLVSRAVDEHTRLDSFSQDLKFLLQALEPDEFDLVHRNYLLWVPGGQLDKPQRDLR